jgi:manganese-dependent inorganic pyrophosphatase
MRLKRIWVLAATLVCGAFMLTSCSNDDNAVVEPEPEAGAEYRAILKKLDWGKDTTFVYGHKVPDVDAVCSSLSFAKLMRTLGYNCKAKVSSGVNRETEYAALTFGFDLPELKTSVAEKTRLILTDHSDYVQCVEGAREAIILQVIDHHVEGDIKDSSIPYVRREMIGSTCTIIYEMYKELGVSIDYETARILLAGIVSDTRNLTKPATCAIDTVAWEALTAQLGISPDSIAVVSKHMSEAADDYFGMTDKEIFMSDYKGYDYNGYQFGMGSLDCKAEEMDDFIDRMLAVMPEVLAENGLDMVFAKIDNKVPNPEPNDPDDSYINAGTYFIYYGVGAREVAEAIIGPSLREGVVFSEKKMSRKQIVPLIQDQLTNK